MFLLLVIFLKQSTTFTPARVMEPCRTIRRAHACLRLNLAAGMLHIYSWSRDCFRQITSRRPFRRYRLDVIPEILSWNSFGQMTSPSVGTSERMSCQRYSRHRKHSYVGRSLQNCNRTGKKNGGQGPSSVIHTRGKLPPLLRGFVDAFAILDNVEVELQYDEMYSSLNVNFARPTVFCCGGCRHIRDHALHSHEDPYPQTRVSVRTSSTGTFPFLPTVSYFGVRRAWDWWA
jgi:hypothetical protein